MSRSLPPPDGLLAHAEFLRALARSLVADAHEADDVVQGAYLAALEHPPKPGSNLRAWLGTVTRNLAFGTKRSAGRRGRREAKVAPSGRLASTAEVAARIELQRKIVEAVHALKEPYRSTIIYRFFDGLSPAEIADATGVPLKTVKSRLYRALGTLRGELDREHDGDRSVWSLALLPWFDAGRTSAVAQGAWAGFVGLTMKKAVLLLLAGIAATFLLWTEYAPDKGATVPRTPDATPVAALVADAGAPSKTEGATAETADKAAFTFAGRVVDEDGNGVADAHVALLYVSNLDEGRMTISAAAVLRRERERREAPSATTDGGGRFSIDRPYDSRSCLRVEADGFASAFAGPVLPGEQTTIRLSRRNSMVVRVRDEAGKPLAGAKVQVTTRYMAGAAWQVLAEARTGHEGEVRLPQSPTHQFWLVVEPGRFDLAYVERSYDTNRGDIEIVVPAAPVGSVRVLDAKTGTPIPDAYVIIGSSEGTMSFDKELARRRFGADDGGVVRFPNQAGYYVRRVTAPGYELTEVDRDEVRLRRSMRVDGVVLDPGGAPVPDAPVLVANPGGLFDRAYAALPVVSAWTDGAGRFSLEIKLLASYHRAVADAGIRSLVALVPPHAPAIEDEVAIQPGGQVTVELRAPSPASVAVSLTGAQGEPVRGKSVQLLRKIPASKSWSTVGWEFGGVSFPRLADEALRKTDESGRVLFGSLPAGDYILWVQHTKRKITLAAGERNELRIRWGSGDAVFGRVLDAAGDPVVGVNVGLGGPSSWVLQTDSEGRFRFDEVERGHYTLSVFGGGHLPMMKLPAPLNQEIMVRLPAGPARLRIVVSGVGAERIEYAATPERGMGTPAGSGFLALESDGRTLEMTPGRGVLVVRVKGRGWRALAYDAPAKEITEIRIELPEAGSVAGTLAEIPDAKHVRVQLMPESTLPDDLADLATLGKHAIGRCLGQASKSVEPDAEGRFRLDDLSPGAYRARLLLWNDRKWKEAANVAVRVEPGATTALHLGAPK